MLQDLSMPETASLVPYAVVGLRIATILIAAFALSWLVRKTVRKTQERVESVMKSHGDMGGEAIAKRAATIGGILRATSAVVIWTVAIIMCLREAGFDVTPLLAGAGIAGVAIGFGAQSLVKDVISGVFMLLEDQIRIGDVVEINGTGGLVEEINLRTTILRSARGSVHIFQNGGISSLTNLTRDYSYYVFEIGVAYKEDTDRVVEVLQQVAAELAAEPEYRDMIIAPLEVNGVDRFDPSAVIIRSRIKTRPSRQWTVGRELNRRFKKRFDEVGIEIPYPHMRLYFGESEQPPSPPGAASLH